MKTKRKSPPPEQRIIPNERRIVSATVEELTRIANHTRNLACVQLPGDQLAALQKRFAAQFQRAWFAFHGQAAEGITEHALYGLFRGMQEIAASNGDYNASPNARHITAWRDLTGAQNGRVLTPATRSGIQEPVDDCEWRALILNDADCMDWVVDGLRREQVVAAGPMDVWESHANMTALYTAFWNGALQHEPGFRQTTKTSANAQIGKGRAKFDRGKRGGLRYRKRGGEYEYPLGVFMLWLQSRVENHRMTLIADHLAESEIDDFL